MTSLDSAVMRAALERQRSELAPLSRVLSALAVFPPRLQPGDWRGESAEACERVEERLRERLRQADRAAEAATRSTQAALHEVGG